MTSLTYENLIENKYIEVMDNKICFNNSFNESLDNIIFPDNIKIFVFARYYNKPIDNIKFPNQLEKLFFSGDFNQNIDNVNFPETLTYIFFGNCFNQPLHNVKFPKSLYALEFGTDFNQALNINNLNNLNIIKLSHNENSIPINTLPTNLKRLYIGMLKKPIETLPPNLEFIDIWSNENNNLEKSKIPFGVKVFLEEQEEW